MAIVSCSKCCKYFDESLIKGIKVFCPECYEVYEKKEIMKARKVGLEKFMSTLNGLGYTKYSDFQKAETLRLQKEGRI